jgi:phosphodiesterase/alkaline phosphatase D-like protein
MTPADKPKRGELLLTRRQTLAGAAGLAAATLLPACGPYEGDPLDIELDDVEVDAQVDALRPQEVTEALPLAATAFSLGVASAHALNDDGMLAWTCYHGSRPLELRVWNASTERTEARARLSSPTAPDGAFVRARLPRLTAGGGYHYAFVELDDDGAPLARSEVGAFTAPSAPAATPVVTLAATGCTEFGVPFDVLEAAGREQVDAHVLLGDIVYSDDAVGLNGLRGLWHATMGTPGYRAMRAGAPVMAVWDDHEFGNNFDPETIDPRRLQDARRSFFEHLPLERYPQAPGRLWRRHRFGSTVEVFVLDTRTERRPSTIGTEDLLLSEAQMAWLEDGLRRSTATFKLIVTGVPITNVPVPEGEGRWPGYVRQREQLLRLCEEEIDGVLFLAGDIHMCWIGRVSPSGLGANLIEVGAGCGAKELLNPVSGLFVAPQYLYRAAVNNYATLRFDAERREVTVTHKTATDVLHQMVLEV